MKALLIAAILGLVTAGCNYEKLIIHLSDVSMLAGEAEDTELVYYEGCLFPDADNVCGFEIHLTYDPSVIAFPNCDGEQASHSCGSPADVLCVCNATEPGLVKVILISATALATGPTVLGTFPVETAASADPGMHRIGFALNSPVGYIRCDSLETVLQDARFLGAEVVILQP